LSKKVKCSTFGACLENGVATSRTLFTLEECRFAITGSHSITKSFPMTGWSACLQGLSFRCGSYFFECTVAFQKQYRADGIF